MISFDFPYSPLNIHVKKVYIDGHLQNQPKITILRISRLKLGIQSQIQLGMSFLFRFRHNLYPV